MNSPLVIHYTKFILCIVLIFSFLVQMYIDNSIINFYCGIMTVVFSTITFFYTLSIRRFSRTPISSLMVIGFNVSSLSGALIVQTAYLKSLIYNLDVPLQTFSWLCFTQFVTIATHFLYRRSYMLNSVRAWITQRVYSRLGLMTAPSQSELWIFGFVGCFATLFTAQSYTNTIQFGDVSSKFFQGYVPFSVAPFFIPMRSYIFGQDSNSQSQKNTLWITLYTLFLIVVAMANNARGTFSAGFMTLALSCLIAVLSGRYNLTHRKLAWGFLGVAASIPLFLTISDLATAMVIARDERSNVSSVELISITFSNFQDKPLLEERRHRDAVISGGDYNEAYIGNPLFARFVYTKFVDVNMNNANSVADKQATEIIKETKNKIVAMLPTPVINYFDLRVEKADLGFSSGDLYSFIARGLELGGFTTGSEIPDGLTLFGQLFWPILCVALLLQFILYDSFSISGRATFNVSAAVLLNVVPIFTLGVMQESFSNQVISIFRGVPQLILLYWTLRVAAQIMIRPLLGFRRSQSGVAAE